MELEIRTREMEGVSVVVLRGRLVLGEASKGLRDLLYQFLSEGKRRFVLNLANVTYIDSAGIGTLVAAYSAVQKQGGSLKRNCFEFFCAENLSNLSKLVHHRFLRVRRKCEAKADGSGALLPPPDIRK